MDIIYDLFFWGIAAVLLISALGVVFMPKIVYSAVSMLIAFLSAAGIFLLLNADFIAISQIIIYAVGITIVMIFAIMLTGRLFDKKLWIAFAPRTLFAFAIAGAFFVTILFAVTDGFRVFGTETGIFTSTVPLFQTVETMQTAGTAGILGESLLTKYVLPFEILSLLLLAAIIGAAVIAKKDDDNLVNPGTAIKDGD